MDLIIRAFDRSDAASVSAVIRETMRRSNGEDYPLSVLQPLIDYFSPAKVLRLGQERRCLVAEIGDEIVGTISLEESELCTFFVLPDFQRRGIGRKLLQAMEEVAAFSGHRRLHVDSSITGVPFYAGMGYRRTGIDIDGSAGPQIGMEKDLPDPMYQ